MKRLVRFEADAQARACSFSEAFQRTRRRHGLTAFQSSDHGLRRSHRLGDLLLSHLRIATGLDERRRHSELVFQRVIGGDVFWILVPFQERFFHRAVSISRRGVLCVFLTNTCTTTTRWPVAVT